jgi:Protein of unknown function (DUF5674)
MTITKSSPYTKEDIEKLREQFDVYIKTVIDINKNICSAGCDLHADSEKILLEQGSQQEELWGGGINLETKEIDFNSFINIRPKQKNTSIEIQSPEIREAFEKRMKQFFSEVL